MPQEGGLGSQPAKYPTLMAMLADAVAQEQDMQRDETSKGKGKGSKSSPTETFLDEQAQAKSVGDVSPDSPINAPGLRAPRKILRRS